MLKASGQFENTLIVFSSDHGLAIGSHGLFGKQNLYDHSMRAPLIMAGPGIPAGKTSDAFCYLLDIFPTLGELARVTAPVGSEGRSLAPILAGRQTQGRDSIFTAYTGVQRALRDERWKLIVYPKVNKTQLFDLKNDPFELRDLAAVAEHRDQVQKMTVRLKESQRQFDDTQALDTANPQPLEFDFTKVKQAKKPTPIE